MNRIFFDIETDGLLDKTTKIHCIETIPESSEEILTRLTNADELIGHNIICFDIPAIKRVYPSFNTRAKLVDTLLLSRLLFPNIAESDFITIKKNPNFPKKLIGSHSLKAWGYRLGIYKGTFGETTDWSEWSQEMQDYCRQDVLVTKALYEYMVKTKHICWEAYDLEWKFQEYIHIQEQNGCPFDIEKAQQLAKELQDEYQHTLTEIKRSVPDRVERTFFTPKRNDKRRGYVAGVPTVKETIIEFNPNSRMQVEQFLRDKYGWQPTELTETGRAKINDTILDDLEPLSYPEAKLFAKLFTLGKLIGYVTNGDNAWTKLVHPRTNRIHGSVITLGAVTRRCTHNKPNMSQVPSVRKFKGKECRSLFYAPKGFSFVGGDASGIELRMFAHYLAAYDQGVYASVVSTGDIHTRNQQDAGLPTRDNAKTFIYALLYGAGDAKLGLITRPDSDENTRKACGSQLRQSFAANNPAYGRLVSDVKAAFKSRGYILSLDGHRLVPRAEHSSLNTLLQAGAAIIMKRATIILWEKIVKNRYEAYPALHIHDEIQLIVKEDQAEIVGKLIVESIKEAGEYYKLKCPLTGEYKVGTNWAETH